MLFFHFVHCPLHPMVWNGLVYYSFPSCVGLCVAWSKLCWPWPPKPLQTNDCWTTLGVTEALGATLLEARMYNICTCTCVRTYVRITCYHSLWCTYLIEWIVHVSSISPPWWFVNRRVWMPLLAGHGLVLVRLVCYRCPFACSCMRFCELVKEVVTDILWGLPCEGRRGARISQGVTSWVNYAGRANARKPWASVRQTDVDTVTFPWSFPCRWVGYTSFIHVWLLALSCVRLVVSLPWPLSW